MGRSRSAAIGLAALALVSAPASAQPADYDHDFVAAFAEACVPGRLSYEATRAAVLAAGWTEVAPADHPRLASVLAFSEAEASDPDFEIGFEYTPYARAVSGLPHHLVVSRSRIVFDTPDAPWVVLGCYLYNFEATAPLHPDPVTKLIGNPVSDTREDEGYVGHIWGPPCPMPRTGDTYLNFVAEGSPLTEAIPFVGVALNFTTSELPEGAEPPAPYC